ncbi:MAG TPA: hypothetical protein VM283_03990, partial [Armatimonadota bacterium]|nr:hypothetical protein [Armatimonadota bacterium]
ARIDTSRTIPGANIWYFGWHDWVNERYPAQGQWWCRVGNWAKQSAEDFKAAIAQYQTDGFKCYLYFRDIANLAQRGTVIPDDWVRTSAGGALDMYGGGYTVQLPEEISGQVGYSEIPWGIYNFDNDAMRADYLEQCRACMDYYLPAGIGWDMGWRPYNQGILAVQAEMYRWLAEHHPQMRVIGNEASGSPSQWFADCILIENGILYGKSAWDYEVAKAFGTQIASIERGHLFRKLAELIVQGKAGWAFPTGRADAERFATWALAQPDMPADEAERIERLTFRLHMRGGLRNLGLGAQWAYADGMRYYRWPLPEWLIAFMTELMSVPLVTDSYAVRVGGGSDSEDGVHAAAWADAGRLRVAVFNDNPEPREVKLALDRKALRAQGWAGAGEGAAGFTVDTAAALVETGPGVSADAQTIALTTNVPAFGLAIVTAEAP